MLYDIEIVLSSFVFSHKTAYIEPVFIVSASRIDVIYKIDGVIAMCANISSLEEATAEVGMKYTKAWGWQTILKYKNKGNMYTNANAWVALDARKISSDLYKTLANYPLASANLGEFTLP